MNPKEQDAGCGRIRNKQNAPQGCLNTQTALTKRLASTDVELSACNGVIERAIQKPMPAITAKQLAELLGVFAGFQFLAREQKRSIMAATRARIFTSGYLIEQVELSSLISIEKKGKKTNNAIGSSYVDSP